MRWLHMSFGIVTISLLYWQVWNGMQDEWPEMSTNLYVLYIAIALRAYLTDLALLCVLVCTTNSVNTPLSVRIIFWVLFFAEVSAYVFSLGVSALNAITAHAARAAGYQSVAGNQSPEAREKREELEGEAPLNRFE